MGIPGLASHPAFYFTNVTIGFASTETYCQTDRAIGSLPVYHGAVPAPEICPLG